MLYKQIAQDIKDDIINQKYKVNDKLPSETELAKKYNASRMTIRKSISLLIYNGIVFAKPKSGYFVNSFEDIASFNSLNGGSLYYLNKGRQITTLVLNFEILKARPFLAEKFDISDQDEIIHISRIRYLDGNPYVVEDIYMPNKLFSDINIEDAKKSIYKYIESKGYQIGTNRKNISANFLPKLYHTTLPKLISSPLLQVENTGYLYNGICFEYSISFQINQEVSIITDYNSILK